jgi:alcohol dehydrogenase, propanol-preferring
VLTEAKTMPAYRVTAWGEPPVFCDVPIPVPQAGEVRVRVGAAGLCASDLLMIGEGAKGFPGLTLPFTLGHEIAGTIESVGDGVDEALIGNRVVVEHHCYCEQCAQCLLGRDNYCLEIRGRALGFGADGGLSTFVVVPQSRTVTLSSLSLAEAAPIADAARTAYHAVSRVAVKLPTTSKVLVIGVGGLGSYAIQFLHLIPGVQITAIDIDPMKQATALALGATQFLTVDEGTQSALLTATDGLGFDGVLDFVGSGSTLELCARVARVQGIVALVGAHGGVLKFGFGMVPYDCDFFIPRGGTYKELCEVVTLIESGVIRSNITTMAFDDVFHAYELLAEASHVGRLVIEMPTP